MAIIKTPPPHDSAPQIASLLLPLQDRKLILPVEAVADITPMAGLIVESRAERWVLGHKHWRNLRVPIIAFETYAGGSLKKHSEHARIAIINRYNKSAAQPVWGILIQGKPTRLGLSEQELIDTEETVSKAEHSCVNVKNVVARIPDLDALEKSLMEIGVLI